MTIWLRLALVSAVLFSLILAINCENDSEKSPKSGWYIEYKRTFENNRYHQRSKRFTDHLGQFWSRTKERIKRVLDKIVPRGIQKLFSKNEENETSRSNQNLDIEEYHTTENDQQDVSDKNHSRDEHNNKEHGNLDFFGRDIIRGISTTAKKVTKKLGFKSSNTTSGLDSNKTFFSGVADKFKEQVQAIYPGTQWCGGGNRAKSYDDLGIFNDTDACCRDHDECPENISAGGTKYGLHNTGLFTRSHCDCDTKFYNCLKTTNSIVSNKIGFTYFTVLGPQCYKQEYPVSDCLKTKTGRCIEYELQSSEDEVYQWFDNPTY